MTKEQRAYIEFRFAMLLRFGPTSVEAKMIGYKRPTWLAPRPLMTAANIVWC